LFLLFCVLSCNGNEEKEGRRLQRLSDMIDLSISPSAHIVEFYEKEYFVDPIWIAKIKLSEKEIDSIKESIVRKPTEKSTVHGGIIGDVNWWIPVGIVLEKQYVVNQNTFVHLVLTRDRKEFYLFVECIVF